jgi:hypothetical protein
MMDTKTEATESALVETPKVSQAEQKKSVIEIHGGSVQLKTLDDQFRWAQYVIDSGLAPKAYTKPSQVMVAAQYGVELGFSGPMTSLKAIHVIEGSPSLSGQAALGLCWSKGIFAKVLPIEHIGVGDDRYAIFSAIRKGNDGYLTTSFSIAEARKAGLLDKKNWKNSPDDMLDWRAIGRWMKRYASDVTLGLPLAEEAQDYDLTIENPKPRIEPRPQDAAPLEFADAIIVDDDEPSTLGAGAFQANPEVPVQKVEEQKKAEPVKEEPKIPEVPFYPAEAHKWIIGEAKRRVGSDEDAVKDFIKEVTGGGVSKIMTREAAKAVAEKMANHSHFGDKALERE